MELLTRYEWPNNYTQFKGVLYELAALTTSSYIRSSAVAELLTRERSLNRGVPPRPDAAAQGQTLDEIIRSAIWQAVSANNGNQTAAARQLGISRTTMWRYPQAGGQARQSGGENAQNSEVSYGQKRKQQGISDL